ncbi:conidiation protein Con-6 [Aspergillus sclerotialis]|uniref:Conidiation protein Con-6 n=1 Tax=Aspergillus sclerotialis TaxID=2070753 RepID=A0A3A2ZT55_9EURO|nr:conidiation protein Con-6 [Aspergillus sclerotialis]
MRGYKATLSNPHTSDEAKKNAQAMLDRLGGDQPRDGLYEQSKHGKDPTRVMSGLKAAHHNPNVTDSGRQKAEEKLMEMNELPEE